MTSLLSLEKNEFGAAFYMTLPGKLSKLILKNVVDALSWRHIYAPACAKTTPLYTNDSVSTAIDVSMEDQCNLFQGAEFGAVARHWVRILAPAPGRTLLSSSHWRNGANAINAGTV